ncbi:MAG: hypothetical protein R3D63_13510 [Paracoccaceae bacterium]
MSVQRIFALVMALAAALALFLAFLFHRHAAFLLAAAVNALALALILDVLDRIAGHLAALRGRIVGDQPPRGALPPAKKPDDGDWSF